MAAGEATAGRILDEQSVSLISGGGRIKRRAVEAPMVKDECAHPGWFCGLCIRCGQKMDGNSGVAFGYIHKNLRLSDEEISRLREKDIKNLLHRKRLYLVLDLDHTLLHSRSTEKLTEEEGYLKGPEDNLPDAFKGSIHKLDSISKITKLRPFVHTFLKEASNLFEMCIYTMGEREYALQMAKLLDPQDVYFHSRVIARGDCSDGDKKGLDVVLGQESAVLILDDSERVWEKHRNNLILMKKYRFFASSSCPFPHKSLSEQRINDESETNGPLASILRVLQMTHSIFFDQERDQESLVNRDVRQVLQLVRKRVLEGCKIVFSRGFSTDQSEAENHYFWKVAESLGASCSTVLGQSVTHVVSLYAGSNKSRWAARESKFLVNPSWIIDTNYLWQKQPEENYPVTMERIVETFF